MVESADEDFEKQVSFGFIKEYNERRPWTRVLSKCPECGKEPKDLVWTKFSSSNRSWGHLAGREGFRSFCACCNVVVEEWITRMS